MRTIDSESDTDEPLIPALALTQNTRADLDCLSGCRLALSLARERDCPELVGVATGVPLGIEADLSRWEIGRAHV